MGWKVSLGSPLPQLRGSPAVRHCSVQDGSQVLSYCGDFVRNSGSFSRALHFLRFAVRKQGLLMLLMVQAQGGQEQLLHGTATATARFQDFYR